MQSLSGAPDKPTPPDPAPVTITPYPDTSEWSWPKESQKQWEELTGEDEEYVVFSQYWRNPASRSNFRNKFPYQLPLGVASTTSPTGTILVTEGYDKMYRQLLDLRKDDRLGPPARGAVVAGQPGIGALQPDLHTA